MIYKIPKKQINILSSKLKEEANAKHLLILGLIVIILYKVWKNFIIGFHDSSSSLGVYYYFDQTGFSVYRALASALGLFLIQKNYVNFKAEFLIGHKKIALLNIFSLVLFLGLNLTFKGGFIFRISHFSKELFFNFLTGSFEEIIFRGILLVVFARYFRPMKSIFISSLLFSLWHYDVVSSGFEYVIIFLWSCVTGLSYYVGASLLSLIIVHFLWDQIHFGFYWDTMPGLISSVYAFLLCLMSIVFFIFLYMSFYLDNNYLNQKKY